MCEAFVRLAGLVVAARERGDAFNPVIPLCYYYDAGHGPLAIEGLEQLAAQADQLR